MSSSFAPLLLACGAAFSATDPEQHIGNNFATLMRSSLSNQCKHICCTFGSTFAAFLAALFAVFLAALSAEERQHFLLHFWQYFLLHIDIEHHNGAHWHLDAAIEAEIALFATIEHHF
jgi:hypothetical protein